MEITREELINKTGSLIKTLNDFEDDMMRDIDLEGDESNSWTCVHVFLKTLRIESEILIDHMCDYNNRRLN